MMKLVAVFFLVSSALAAPPSFDHQGNKAIFADFLTANYKIQYDVKAKKAVVVTEIEFATTETGHPLFDLIEEPTDVTLDGKQVQADEISSPDFSTYYRMLSASVAPGNHKLKLTNAITLLRWSNNAVNSGFFVTDLNDRSMIEQYIPTSLEWDAYKMTFEVKVLNSSTEHKIYTNTTTIQTPGMNTWILNYPETYSTSSIYL